jgi:CheY-like chemotaxis protein
MPAVYGKKGKKSMSARKRILVVDDEDMILDICTSLLEDEGYDVITAQHPSLALVQCNNIDLIILDLKLSDRNDLEGNKVLGRLWEDECYSIPVIIYSALITSTHVYDSINEVERRWGKGRKIFKYVEKGGGVRKLIDAVNEYFSATAAPAQPIADNADVVCR